MKIGFVGLGLMGKGMAARLRHAGLNLSVCDLRRDLAEDLLAAGAIWKETPAQLALGCDLVFTSLPRPDDVEKVGFGSNGLVEGLRPGSIWIDLSTNGLEQVQSLHRRLKERGISFLDAPVSGGPQGAASGKLAILVGGDKSVFLKVAPVLHAMGDQVRHVGDIGAGTTAKLVHNLASLTMVTVAAEAMTLGTKAGMDPLVLWEAIRSGVAGRLRSFDNIGKRYLPGRLDPPSFELALALKDMTLALDMARHVQVPMRLSTLAQLDMVQALNRGWGKRDAHAFLQLQTERAGLPQFELDEAKIAEIMTQG